MLKVKLWAANSAIIVGQKEETDLSHFSEKRKVVFRQKQYLRPCHLQVFSTLHCRFWFQSFLVGSISLRLHRGGEVFDHTRPSRTCSANCTAWKGKNARNSRVLGREILKRTLAYCYVRIYYLSITTLGVVVPAFYSPPRVKSKLPC